MRAAPDQIERTFVVRDRRAENDQNDNEQQKLWPSCDEINLPLGGGRSLHGVLRVSGDGSYVIATGPTKSSSGTMLRVSMACL